MTTSKAFEKQTVIVTGAASGLGLALVRRFLAEGACVVGVDLRTERVEEARRGLDESRIAWVVGSVTDFSVNMAAVELAQRQFGGLDVFVGNAGVWDFGMSLMDLPPERIDQAFDEVFSVNVKGYLLGAKAAAPALKKSRGAIVFTLSNAALYPAGGGPLYTASKHAGVGLTRQLAYELAPDVRVNAVAVSGMQTALSGPAALAMQDRQMASEWDAAGFASLVPLNFTPTPDEYTGGFTLMASRTDGAPITGVVLPVELGWGVRGLRSVRATATASNPKPRDAG